MRAKTAAPSSTARRSNHGLMLLRGNVELSTSHNLLKCSATSSTPDYNKTLDTVGRAYSSKHATPHPRKQDDCGEIWTAVLKELNAAMRDKFPLGQGRRLSTKRRALLQQMAAVVLITLPGLVRDYHRGRSARNAQWVQKVLNTDESRGGLRSIRDEHGYSATLLDYFILPHMQQYKQHIPPDDEDRGVQSVPSNRTLQSVLDESYCSKATALAR